MTHWQRLTINAIDYSITGLQITVGIICFIDCRITFPRSTVDERYHISKGRTIFRNSEITVDFFFLSRVQRLYQVKN